MRRFPKTERTAMKIAEYRILGLTSSSSGLVLRHNETAELRKGVFLTLNEERGEALLEVHETSGDSYPHVTVNGEKVIDLAQLRTGDLLEIEEHGSYVLLKPFEAYIRENAADRMERLRELVASEELATAILNNLNETSDAERSLVTVLPLPTVFKSRARTRSLFNGKIRFSKKARMLLIGALAINAASLIAFSLLKDKPSNDVQGKETSLESANVTSPRPQDPTSEAQNNASAIQQAESAAPSQKETEQPKADLQLEDERLFKEAPESNQLQSAEAPDRLSQKPIQRVVKAEKSESPAKTKASSKANVAKLSPEQEAKYYQLIDSYVLEANFDPAGAKQKLRLLLKELPRGSALARKVNNELNRL